jgi:glyoxylase-like metal-dependent hydrolase (beta-lactamase superfamily II)
LKSALIHWKLVARMAGAALALIPGHALRAQSSSEIEVLRVRPNFYMIAGAGGNIGVQIGPDGVVLVDAGTEKASGQVLAEIKRLTDQPIRYIINTSADADHVGGNARLAKAGHTIFAMANNDRENFDKLMTNGGAASILASEMHGPRKVFLRSESTFISIMSQLRCFITPQRTQTAIASCSFAFPM